MTNFFFDMQKVWNRYVFRVKYHLLYAAFAQIMLMAINVLIFITSELNIPFSPFYCVVPTYFYLVLCVLFYLLNYQMNKKISRQSIFSGILLATILIVNVIYTGITTADEEGWLYYIDTVLVQVINALYIMIYITANGRQYAQGRQLNLLRIFAYVAAAIAMLAFYFTLAGEPMLMWSLMVVTNVLLFGVYMIFHENIKKTLPKKKRLRSHVRIRLPDSSHD